MEKEPLSPPKLTYEQYKSAPRITLAQLLACFPAYEAFKRFRKSAPKERPYAVRVIENEKFFYVCFDPDHEKIEGRIFGGGITYIIDKNTDKIVTEILSR